MDMTRGNDEVMKKVYLQIQIGIYNMYNHTFQKVFFREIKYMLFQKYLTPFFFITCLSVL